MSKPDAIWLQYGDDDPDDHEYRNEVTWCDATINSSDVKFLRATPVREAAPELLAQLKETRQVLVVACGTEAPYIRIALQHIDRTIAQAEGGDTGWRG